MMGIKYPVNEQFFDTWSNEMAYVLGYIYADGCVIDTSYIRGNYVCITSTDKDRIYAIRLLLESGHTILEIVKGGNYKKAYQIKIGSNVLFKCLAKLGVHPHKSLTITFPEIPEDYLASFVRGYFDGDGCVFIERAKTQNVKRILTIFTSGSQPFLQSLHEQLVARTGIVGSRVYNHGSSKNAFQLRYNTRDSLRLYMFMYPKQPDEKLYLGRKYDIFNEYLKVRNLNRKTIPAILNTKGPVAKKKRGALQKRYARMRFPSGPP